MHTALSGSTTALVENADVNNQGWCAQENSFQVVWDLKWVRRFSVWDDMVSDVVDIGDVSTIQRGEITCNRVYCVCSGPWPFNFFLSGFFSFLIGWEFYGPNYLKCYNLCAGPAASSFPQCPCSSRSSVSSSCCLCIWFRGEPTLFPGWRNKLLCYSNLWLLTLHSCFQPASLNSPPRSATHSSAIPKHSHSTTVHETNVLTLQAVTVQIITIMMKYLWSANISALCKIEL